MRYAMPNARIMVHQPQGGCGVWISSFIWFMAQTGYHGPTQIHLCIIYKLAVLHWIQGAHGVFTDLCLHCCTWKWKTTHCITLTQSHYMQQIAVLSIAHATHNSMCSDTVLNLMFDSTALSLLLLHLLVLVGMETAIYYLLSGFPCTKLLSWAITFIFSSNSVGTSLWGSELI